jgi:Bacterial SH3 domain
MRGRGLLEADREAKQDATRASDRIAIASALVGGLLVGGFLIAQSLFGGSGGHSMSSVLGNGASQAPRTTAGHVPETAQASSPTSATQPTAAPTANSTDRRQVRGTDNEGVVLRASPRDDDKLPRGFLEGDWVTILERSGADWALVRGDNGQQGWVPTRYLGP